MSCETFQTNTFDFPEYENHCSFFEGQAPLSQGVGWAIVVGFGVFFNIFTSFFVWLDAKFSGDDIVSSSEGFNTAGRSIKMGLGAAVVVSQWTWAATLLQSSNVAWKYGVSGPFWYASGATIQVILFGILAIEIKRKAPKAHTVLEIIRARWGDAAHKVFFVFCLMTNIIVTAMLILGGAAVTNALTGMDIYAAAFLIPCGVIIYTMHGGLKATFMATYFHTVVVYIALCIFVFQVYATNSDLGSISKVYDNLQIVAGIKPVVDNYEGSFLTMLSKGGFIFGIINIIGNFGTVFVDQSYWQSAIAAKPSATYKVYIMGGLAWFCIPFTLATSLGLAARALDLPLTADEAGDGLVPPAVAIHLLGKGGGILIMIMLFMAVTSTASAEQIAVASLISYDLYRTYINKNATGKQVVWMSRIMIAVYGVLSGALAVILLKIGLSLGWVYLFMGVVIGSAVLPITFCLTWRRISAAGAIAGSISGTIAAIIAWLTYTAIAYDEVSVDTTGQDYPMLTGNLVSILFSGFVCVIVSLFYPQNYEWSQMNTNLTMIEADGTDKLKDDGEDSYEAMTWALKWTCRYGIGMSLLLVVVWPVLALPAKVFSEGYFTMWVVISIIWGLVATAATTILPIFESRDVIGNIAYNFLTCNPQADSPDGLDGYDQKLSIWRRIGNSFKYGDSVKSTTALKAGKEASAIELNTGNVSGVGSARPGGLVGDDSFHQSPGAVAADPANKV